MHGLLLYQEEIIGLLTESRTQIRRPLVPQPWYRNNELVWGKTKEQAFGYSQENEGHGSPHPVWSIYCPIVQPEETVYVKESFALDGDLENDDFDIHYRINTDPEWPGPWRPSSHMPEWASRFVLTIVSTHVGTVRDMTISDCISEGLTDYLDHDEALREKDHQTMRKVFREQWDRRWRKKGYGWRRSPYCWVISFHPSHRSPFL